jgi:N-acyl-D-amino-acid deacylase
MEREMFDIIIRNGLIVDGTGSRGYRADIGISGDKIAVIGELDSSAVRIVEAEGLVVAPGFIDVHSHTDDAVLVNPFLESKLTQGVTLELSGNCGDSPAPRSGSENSKGWTDMREYLAALDETPMAINFATLVGHGSIRAVAVGYDDRPATDAEMDVMRGLVDEAMAAGAFGLSTGLIYPPGCYASTEELIELSKVVSKYGGFYATHLRSESDMLIESVDEALRIGRESGCAVQLSHHKASGHKNWGKVKQTLAMIDSALESGMDVCADQYPYLATSTGLGAVLPNWAHDGGRSALMARLRDPEQRRVLRDTLVNDSENGWIRDTGGWSTVLIGQAGEGENRRWEGMNIEEIAKAAGKHPCDVVLDMLFEENGDVEMMHFVIDEGDLRTVMAHPAVVIGSDATARCSTGPLSLGMPHPRAYGTFPRVLGRYVREEGVLTLEEGVAKMTGRTARRLGLKDRGVLTEGNYADITIFDPAEIKDMSTYTAPRTHACGISKVIVNGVIVLDGGRIESTGKSAGRVLRHTAHL